MFENLIPKSETRKKLQSAIVNAEKILSWNPQTEVASVLTRRLELCRDALAREADLTRDQYLTLAFSAWSYDAPIA